MARQISFPIIAGSLLIVVGGIWLQQVSLNVPEPYLDEVFHVPQAQAYCKGKWHIWDPKITTPPGLYLFSPVLQSITKYFDISSCETFTLRLQNCIAVIVAIPVATCSIHKLLQSQAKKAERPPTDISSEDSIRAFNFAVHTALNIALFPPLFFFSALYYTEPWSIFWVLLAHPIFSSGKSSVKSKRSLGHSLLLNSIFVVQGIVALLYRQTNIFWIVVFYGGLDAVQILETKAIQLATLKAKDQTYRDIMVRGWKSGYIYDLPVNNAWLQDYFKTSISLLFAALGSINVVLSALTPHLALLIAFGAFTIWNGGVVLGDKSNHVASLHLSQMLYIWPYFMFFSFPAVYPYLINAFSPGTLRRFPRLNNKYTRDHPRLSVAFIFTGLMLCIVRFNTIVHPFLLADNRHYVFYVFRWVLLRHPAAKYLVVPIYFVCGWAIIIALGGTQRSTSIQTKPPKGKNNGRDDLATTRANRVSFVIVWLTATALSLVTAPLVEPRYFILPWMMWRLYLPNSLFTIEKARSHSGSHSYLRKFFDCRFSSQLWLETVWFLFVNSFTMYLFLYRGFKWPQEPGNVQRFMW
ncbi:hypothetical protein FGG08_002211 [Glutinoglossum americanum]|uniref:Dol-P-Glc:Glc(2)Man(9)GlcNAc(2)-PP-Dol alpha-1,2-glucosyltransferase n=1 Tax=Glutinoglossum americanum TaxID=1670608 RepID=A0A9P8L4N4_9PEZI|nr:hypothetical protein FGG08_002211 [Glutinoglossum americanum]